MDKILLERIKKLDVEKIKFSFLDLFYQIKNLEKKLKNKKIDKIFQFKKNEIILQLVDLRTKEKIFLNLNNIFPYISQTKKNKKDQRTQFAFCEFLRKRITNFRIGKVYVPKSDRILIIEIKSPDEKEKYYLINEMISNGNLILTDNNFIIKNIVCGFKSSERNLKINNKYVFPKIKIDFLNDKEKDIQEKIKKEIKENKLENKNKDVVHFLATDINLGGKIAEKICKEINIDKHLFIENIDNLKIEKISEAIKKLFEKKEKFEIIINKTNNKIIDAHFFDMDNREYKKNVEIIKLGVEKINPFLEIYFDKIEKKEEQKERTKKNKKIKKIENIIKAQTQELEKNKRIYEESMKKGELIYLHFKEINKIFERIVKIHEKNGWEEVKKEIEKIKKKNEINKKEKIVVEGIDSKKGIIKIKIKNVE